MTKLYTAADFVVDMRRAKPDKYMEEERKDWDENDFYDEDKISDMLEDDEISLEEEAFMIGYMSA